MTYAVKEIFYTLQGEGANAGRPAVFCRFAGCNLWSGLERDRDTAVCKFCDTDFVGTDGTRGGKYPDATQLATTIAREWTANSKGKRLVVCTGGEPLLQLDAALIDALHAERFEIAVETNGTIAFASRGPLTCDGRSELDRVGILAAARPIGADKIGVAKFANCRVAITLQTAPQIATGKAAKHC